MMGWLLGERRGPEWKQGWRTRCVDSLSLPPAPLIAIFGIVLLFLALSPSRKGYWERAERAEAGLQLLLLLVPLALVFAAKWLFVDARLARARELRGEHHGTPWGMAALLLLLLLMISLHSSIQSYWFRPLWHRL